MSTCAGAPAPHRCDHGDACDWTPFSVEAGIVSVVEKVHGLFRSVEETIGDKLRDLSTSRQTKTPARALAAIEKLETADIPELGVAVYVWPEAAGRVTGFGVGCDVHGEMPVNAPSKRAGHLAAARHVLHEHGRAGTVVLTGKRPKLAADAEVRS